MRIGELLGEATVGSHHSHRSEGVAKDDRHRFRRLAANRELVLQFTFLQFTAAMAATQGDRIRLVGYGLS
jgi:hypothetical protein